LALFSIFAHHFFVTHISAICHTGVTQYFYALGFQLGVHTMTHSTLFTASRRALLLTAIAATMAGCATGPGSNNLAETIANTPTLSTLNTLVTQAGLANTLKTDGPFTVFAPSNDAFKAVPAKTMAELAQNPQKLKEVLTFHVVPGKVMTPDVKNSAVSTVNGAKAALSKAGDFVIIENAAVTQADIAASNGVVHIIDAVMMPPVKK
jgi:uncharacterized surface protein with fasciclin (FAS1) repeats